MKFIIENINAPVDLLASIAWKSLIILALVWGAMILWRRSAAARHLAWTMTFLCLLALPVFVRCFPAWHPPVWITSSSFNNNLPNSLKFVLGNFARQNSETLESISEKQIGPPVSQNFSPPVAPVKS